MNRTACCALLLGSLLPLSAAADKAGGAGGAGASADLAKSLMPAGPAGAPEPHLNRGDISALLGGADTFGEPAHRPGVMLDELGRPRVDEDNPLGRRGAFGRPAMDGLHWNDASGARGLVDDYNAFGDAVKAKIFGKGLSRHLDIDLDGSPHIRYEVEFD